MTNKIVHPTSIPEYFAGQFILITGGTGFMGKVLIEKILRCCPDVAMIYILIRPKRSENVKKRWKELSDLPLFDVIRSTNPDSLNKVCPIEGDIDKPNVGLSEENIQMLIDKVTIIYHAAAMIQFSENLSDLMIKNTIATYVLLNIAKRMKNLQLFVHVSTAFSNMHLPCHEVKEEVMPAVQDWKVIMDLIHQNPLAIAALKEKLMCGHPNPYTWSKSLAEQVVNDFREYFPTIIMRPAVVCPSYREPFQGWADILCGLSAISVPIGLGLMRIIYTRPECYQDYIPVDTAINAMIVGAWKKFKEPDIGYTNVYNCGVVKEVPITTHDLISKGYDVVREYASKNIVWAYHTVCTTNDHLFHLLFILLQVIPGAFLDTLLFLTGNKPMLLNLTKKVANVFRLFKKFSSAQLEFENDNFKGLEKYVSEQDKTFSVSVDGLTSLGLMRFGLKAALVYYIKEDLSEENIRKNRRRLFWLEVLDKCVIYIFYAIAAWILYRFLASFETLRNIGFIAYKAFIN